jgi:hypothetical protein
MTMLGAGVVILLIAFSAVGFLWVLPTYRRFRGKWVVTCPEAREPAGVEVDAAHVAASAWGGRLDLRLKSCSRWPKKANCGQECLAEVERDAEATGSRWFRVQSCVSCGSPIPGALADVLSNQKPVCWDCHIALSVVRGRASGLTVLPEARTLYH